MLRRLIGYGPANLLPALFAFLVVCVFTRMLPRSEYGIYILAWNGVLLGQSVLFFALANTAARLYPVAEAQGSTADLMKSSYLIFGLLVSALLPLLAAVIYLQTDAAIWLTIPLLALRGLVNVNQDLNRMANHAITYNIIMVTDTLVSFATAFVLVDIWPSAFSLLAGMCIGSLCCVIISAPSMVSAWRLGNINQTTIRQIGYIALPLALTFLLSGSLMYADRFIVGGFISRAELATYAVAWALVLQPVTIIGGTIAVATLPLAMHALDAQGFEAGQRQASRNGILVVALVLPACAGLAICHEHIADFLTGTEYHAAVTILIPYMAGIAAVRGISMSYLEHAFYLSKRTDQMFYAYIPATVANIGLNLIAAPLLGVPGVLMTAAICQALMTGGLLLFGRRVFPLLLPLDNLIKVIGASVIMMMAISLLDAPVSWVGLIEQVTVGLTVYSTTMFVINGVGMRTWLLSRV